MKNHIILLSAINGFIVVLLGAFGAHGLESILSESALATWSTAVQYHMFHTLALFLVGNLMMHKQNSSLLKYSVTAFISGLLLFCGSLYLLALTGISILGIITPFGGLGFLAGWGLLAWQQIINSRKTI